MNKIKDIAKIIKKSKSIALFTHISPDCDALGSTFGLSLALKKLGKNVKIFMKDDFTASQHLLFDENEVCKGECNINDFDIFICCDASSINRLGEYGYVFENNDKTIVIDHHVCNKMMAKYNYIESESSSCCEVVFKFINALKVKLDSEIATKLYAGLSTDTSSFINSNTNANSFLVATKLCLANAKTQFVNQAIYQSKSLNSVVFKKYLLDNFKIDGECAYVGIDQQTLEQLNGKKNDCSGYSKALINYKEINYSFSLIEEEPNKFSLSMRSKIGFNIRIIAEKLGGGGHVCAAGATITANNLNEAINLVLSTINENKERIKTEKI